jgi:hypothetical protein
MSSGYPEDSLIAYEVTVSGVDVNRRDVIYNLNEVVSVSAVDQGGWNVLAYVFTDMQRRILWDGNVDKTKLQWSCRGVSRWDYPLERGRVGA